MKAFLVLFDLKEEEDFYKLDLHATSHAAVIITSHAVAIMTSHAVVIMTSHAVVVSQMRAGRSSVELA